jgi:hypothetical protein
MLASFPQMVGRLSASKSLQLLDDRPRCAVAKDEIFQHLSLPSKGQRWHGLFRVDTLFSCRQHESKQCKRCKRHIDTIYILHKPKGMDLELGSTTSIYSNHDLSRSSKNLISTFTKLFHKSTSNRQGLVIMAKVAATANRNKSSAFSPITKNESLLTITLSPNCFAYGLILSRPC